MTDTRPKTALVISAHAADFVWRCGGAIALHSGVGYEVAVACLSFGERGESARLWKEGRGLDKVKAIRRGEAETAAEVLGVHALECFDLGDYPLRLTDDDKLRLVDLIRAVQPRFMLSHSQYDPYNTDHMYATQVALECRMIAQAWGHNPGEKGLGAPQLYLFELHQTEQMGWKPDTFLDITRSGRRSARRWRRCRARCICGTTTPARPSSARTTSSVIRAARPAGVTASAPRGFSRSFRAPWTSCSARGARRRGA